MLDLGYLGEYSIAMYLTDPRQEEDCRATPMEACREQARNVGQDHPDRPWILTMFDTWEPNPYYSGPLTPHPEDDYP